MSLQSRDPSRRSLNKSVTYTSPICMSHRNSKACRETLITFCKYELIQRVNASFSTLLYFPTSFEGHLVTKYVIRIATIAMFSCIQRVKLCRIKMLLPCLKCTYAMATTHFDG